jgi:hypothetical protein
MECTRTGRTAVKKLGNDGLATALGKRLAQFIADICDSVGPRLGTSTAEQQAGRRIRAEYKKYCDATFAEEFNCHPAAFLDSVRVTVLLYCIGVCLYLFCPLATVLLGLLGLLIYAAEVLYLKEVVDFLFRRRTGVNIYGKVKPSGTRRRIVLISGHHDSAYEFPLFQRLGRRAPTFVTGTVGLALSVIVLALFRALAPCLFPQLLTLLNWLVVVPLVSLVPLLLFGFRLRSSKVVLGANDNLSGVAVTLGVGDWLRTHRLRHTEVWLVSFACEENMRGSKRFAHRHQKELRDAYLLNFDMVGIGPLMIITAEPMYRTKLTPALCAEAGKAAQAAGVAIPLKRLAFAGTDASNFVKAGLQATSVGAIMPEKGPTYWHTLQDTPDKIRPKTLLDAVRLAITFLQRTDQEQAST